MNKREFLKELKESLSLTGQRRLVEENLSFYSSYIEGEMAKGRSEAEVMEELGDPRLIANSIKTAAGLEDTFAPESSAPDYQEDFFQREEPNRGGIFFLGGSKAWLLLGAVFFLTVLFLVLIIALGMEILRLLSPVLLPLFLVLIILGMFGWGRRR